MQPCKTMINALSFDVEEHFHVHAFKDAIRSHDWDHFPSRVGESTRRILHLLTANTTRATFFVLGWVAERCPDLVKEIADGGHEIASHGYAHQAVFELNREEFRRDLQRAGEAILSACPRAELAGYRAPSFSINEATPWALEELRLAGFRYDSSISPASLHDRYGVRGAPRFAHATPSGIVEIPPSTVRFFGHNFPVAGGGHFRLAPLWGTTWAVRRINGEGQPVVTYLHPWEFDAQQPRVSNASWKSKFRHYLNIGKTEARLAKLLKYYRFGRMDDVFATEIESGGELASKSLSPR